MKARELRELTLDELSVKSRELRGDLFNAFVKRSTGQLENTAKLEAASPRHRSGGDRATREAGRIVKNRGMRRTLDGLVVNDKLDKTVVVQVERLIQDPQYKKYVRRYSKFLAHDETNSCAIGDRVRIVEHRPISKRKRWKVQATLAAAARG